MTNRELEIQWPHCAFMKIWSIVPKYAQDTLPSPIRQIGAGACFFIFAQYRLKMSILSERA
jgi:hypothetical protein